jgi:predicted molibdopterin-dependent oxidoreductase YjgC
LCVDTCPTGALTENFKNKILPLPYQKLPAIDPFGSEGFEIDLLAYKNKIYGATSREGIVNQYGLINRDIKFNYNIFNRKDRITQPLLRENGKLKPITTKEAIQVIHNKILKSQIPNLKSQISNPTSIFVSPDLTNESMYMIQKWARAGVKTNAISAVSNINNSVVFNLNKNDNLPLHELTGSKRVYVLGTNLAQDHPVISHIVQNMRFQSQTPVTYITQDPQCFYAYRADETIVVKNYHAFVRAINHYLLKQEKAFGIFIEGLALNFNAYKENILQENYAQLLEKAGVAANIVEKIAQEWLETPESVIIVSEKTIDELTFCELKNSM